MNSILNRISVTLKKLNLFYWIKLFSITGGTQVIVQVVGLISGIIIIHYLPTKEYALYTLANTVLGSITILADGGISNGFMAEGGKVWNDKEKLGVVFASGLDLRRKFSIFSLIFSLPILTYLLIHQGANLLMVILIVISLVPAFLAGVTDSFLEVFPKLHQDIKSLQANQIIVSVGRLALSVFGIFFFPFTFVALLVNGIPRMWGNIKLKKIAQKFVDSKQIPNQEIQKNILKIVKRVLPLIIYNVLLGQISIWILSFSGTKSTESIAQVGALGRLSILLSSFSVIVSTLLLPRFARQPNDRKKLWKSFLQINILIIGFCFLIMLLVILFPTQLLWILGKQYNTLTSELILVMIASCISLLSSITGNLVGARGHIMHPLLLIIPNLACLILALFVWNLSTLHGVLYYNILSVLVLYFSTLAYSIFSIQFKTLKS